MPHRFEEKTVVITGATSEIGRATARRLASEGARLVLAARDAAALGTLARELGCDCRTVVGDLRQDLVIERIIEAAIENDQRIDGLFLNAGVAPFAALDAVTRSSFRDCLEINVVSALMLIQAAMLHLAEGASVLLTASAMQHRPLVESAEWVASTYAVRGLAAALAVELAPRGARVNVLSHGPIDTAAYERYSLPEPAVREIKKGLARGTLLRRLGAAEEVAELVSTLLAPGFMTGSEIVCDGGWALASARGGEAA